MLAKITLICGIIVAAQSTAVFLNTGVSTTTRQQS
ncbi:unnamed protein product, partial [Larinioides sclopetarius]